MAKNERLGPVSKTFGPDREGAHADPFESRQPLLSLARTGFHLTSKVPQLLCDSSCLFAYPDLDHARGLLAEPQTNPERSVFVWLDDADTFQVHVFS